MKEDTSNKSNWRPKSIYVIQNDRTLKFKLPYKKDQSGVANLLFKNKDSGEIFLIDSVINNLRHYSWIFSKCYDVILLYNDGKYLKYEGVSFVKKSNMEVNMENLIVHPSDSESQNWLTLRTYNSIIGERRAIVSENTGNKICGYIFDEKGEVIVGASIIIKDTNKGVVSNIDGYFEINIDANVDPLLLINYVGNKPKEISLTANSGLIVVMERDHKLDNIRVGDNLPLRKQIINP